LAEHGDAKYGMCYIIEHSPLFFVSFPSCIYPNSTQPSSQFTYSSLVITRTSLPLSLRQVCYKPLTLGLRTNYLRYDNLPLQPHRFCPTRSIDMATAGGCAIVKLGEANYKT